LFPPAIDEHGGVISIFGKNIPKLLGLSKLLCKIDVDIIEPAIGLFEDHIDCPVPGHIVGEVPVALSPNNGIDWIQVGTHLTYFPRPQGLRITPDSVLEKVTQLSLSRA